MDDSGEHDDDEQIPWIRIESDEWDTPDIGTDDGVEMEYAEEEVRELDWRRSSQTDVYDLPDFSFLKLKALGCEDAEVLAAAATLE